MTSAKHLSPYGRIWGTPKEFVQRLNLGEACQKAEKDCGGKPKNAEFGEVRCHLVFKKTHTLKTVGGPFPSMGNPWRPQCLKRREISPTGGIISECDLREK